MLLKTNEELAAQVLVTTSTVAKCVGTSPRTVSLWCDRGLLPCFRLPPGNFVKTGLNGEAVSEGDRRIKVTDLVAFCNKRGIPLSADLARFAAPVMLAVGIDGSVPDGWEKTDDLERVGELTATHRLTVAAVGSGWWGMTQAARVATRLTATVSWATVVVVKSEDCGVIVGWAGKTVCLPCDLKTELTNLTETPSCTTPTGRPSKPGSRPRATPNPARPVAASSASAASTS